MSKVLIIEDNENNMELISFILDANGYETIHAFDGISGIQKARTMKPDFIILDIQLPDILGTEVIVELRKYEESRDIPVIAMTSYAMAGDREKLLKAGCNGYIEKPIDPELVMSQIREVVCE